MEQFTNAQSFPPSFYFGEFQLLTQEGIRIYDRDQKTTYDNGSLTLTSHRLLWHHSRKCIFLQLQSVILVEDEVASGGFMRSPKLTLHLAQNSAIIKFAFKEGGEKSFLRKLHDALAQRQWEIKPQQQLQQQPKRQLRSGIGGIEKSIANKNKLTDKQISKAFQDLDKLIEMAKPMVGLAKNISGKIRDKQGDITDDETVQFKSYLLSLGISDPVTRDTHGSGSKYYRELAKEIHNILIEPLKDSGGMMTLTDAFCRVNRARGLELVSPEDLLNACKSFPSSLPLELHTFPKSGVIAIRSTDSETGVKAVKATEEALNAKVEVGLTAEELARSAGISVVLAKERLLAAEEDGRACRDDTVEGLRFFPNLFLIRAQ